MTRSSTLVDPAFWKGKRVLLTGHTGFKGTWTALWLDALGAQVAGLALLPDTEPSLFQLAKVTAIVPGTIADLRDANAVCDIVARTNPQLVLHMAAQPLVRRSVREPVTTFASNIMGTVHLLDALRRCEALEAALIVTTDKVYDNTESGRPFHEHDPLGAHDPYSASKAATEIVVASYARTYFEPRGIPIATARGGNVIGGGDFSEDRIIPDIWRAHLRGEALHLRFPQATRPWQHVLDCIAGYLGYAQALAQRKTDVRALNFGPQPSKPLTVADVADAMQSALDGSRGYVLDRGQKTREMLALTLDSSLARSTLGWTDRLPGLAAVTATARWYTALSRGEDMRAVTIREIDEFLST